MLCAHHQQIAELTTLLRRGMPAATLAPSRLTADPSRPVLQHGGRQPQQP